FDFFFVLFVCENLDFLWIGPYSGSKIFLANLLRICARYNNLDIIEDAYGINLRPLLTLAKKHYEGNNPAFQPKNPQDLTKAEIERSEERRVGKECRSRWAAEK